MQVPTQGVLVQKPLSAPVGPKKLSDLDFTMAQIIWGPSGCGKTTLAATAPGAKLWLQFDPGGCDSIRNRDDIYVLDFTKLPDSSTEKLKIGDSFGLAQFIRAQPEIQTIVVDSVTTFGEMALRHGIQDAAAVVKKGTPPTFEDPGKLGYGRKNTWTNMMVWNIFHIARDLGKHVIFLFHEDLPDKSEDGLVIGITMMVGSSLAEQIPIKFNEVWHLSDTGKERRIMIRPGRMRRPMKSRMFLMSGDGEFVWKYNADTGEGQTIDAWYKQWRETGKKLPVPK